MNRTTRKSALRAAVAHRTMGDDVTIFDTLSLEQVKTKQVCSLLERFEMNSVLFVVNGNEDNFTLSARNISGIATISVDGLNVYDILKHKNLAFTQETAEAIIARLS
jgi:large subunit ribosomal protein L4